MLNIWPLPALSTNYIWVLEHTKYSNIYVVDPGEAGPVLNYLKQNKRQLAAILLTHRHWDHVSGIEELVEQFKCPVYGPAIDQHPTVSHPMSEGDSTLLWGELPASVMETPGHLPDHICWLLESGEPKHVFCADTLFSVGCGRVFGNAHAQLKRSLERLSALPENTVLYPAHEYTLKNLQFALTVEPTSEKLLREHQRVSDLCKERLPSLPTTVAHELKLNPFLRCNDPEVIAAVQKHVGRELTTEIDVFCELRRWKDVY